MTDKIDSIELDINANTTGLTKSKAVVSQFADDTVDKLGRAEGAVKRLDTAQAKLPVSTAKLSKSMGGLGRGAGQASIQVQQLVGQVSGGVNPMIALSQQAADLGIVLGAPLIGSVVGIAAALGATLLPSLFNTEDATGDLIEKLKELKKEFKLTAEQAEALKQAETDETEEKRTKIAEIEKEIKKLSELKALQESQRDSTGGGRSGAANRNSAAGRIEETNRLLIVQRGLLSTLKQEVGDVAQVVSDEEQKKIDILKEYNQAKIDAAASSFKDEQELMSAHKQNLWNIELGYISQTEALEIERDILAQQREITRFDNQIAALGENHALIEEAEKLHQDNLDKISQEHVQRRKAIDESEKQSKLKALSGMFGNLSSLMNTESKKMFEIGKAAAIAGAIVDGYQAVVGAYAQGAKIGGPPLGAAFAATAAVATAVQIQNIAKQKIGGASSAGATSSFSGGTPATNTQSSEKSNNQNITIAGIDRNSLISGGQLIDTLNTALGDGYTINLAGG